MSEYPQLQPSDDRKQRQRRPIGAGTRLAIWRPSEQQYYEGKLTSKRDKDCWKVKHDNGEEDWILLSRETFRVLHPKGSPEAKEQDKHKALLERVKVGSRVEIYWKTYDDWFKGTVSGIEMGQQAEYRIQYDKQEPCWEDLFTEQFKLLDDDNGDDDTCDYIPGKNVDPADITAGTRISVYFDDHTGGQFYDGTVLSDMVIKGNPNRLTKIDFDDGETLDVKLVETDVRVWSILDQAKVSKKRPSNVSKKPVSSSHCSTTPPRTSKKQKLEARDGSDEPQVETIKKAAVPSKHHDLHCVVSERHDSTIDGPNLPDILSSDSPSSSVATAVLASDDANPCPLCKKDIMEHPRSLECYHSFCRACIMSKCESDHFCPICRFPLGEEIHLYGRTSMPEAFQSLVATDVLIGITRTFPSASAATQALSVDRPARVIIDACVKGSLIFGYSWAYSKPCIMSGELDEYTEGTPTLQRASNVSRAVDRVCALSGEDLESFVSVSGAARQLNLDKASISRVARGKQISTGGFCSRYKDSANLPQNPCQGQTKMKKGKWPGQISEDRPMKRGQGKPVERLCTKTKQVLGSYESVAEAARQLSIHRDSISAAARGVQHAAGGYSFRCMNAPSKHPLSEGSRTGVQIHNLGQPPPKNSIFDCLSSEV